jgi:stalled ribosome rescue protein Dom34
LNLFYLLIHEDLFLKDRERTRKLLSDVKNADGKIFIIPKNFEPGAVVEKMGGVVALLRFR